MKKLLFYMLAVLLGGCFPVVSLHPLYTEKDVAFEEQLLGKWVDEPNETVWEFKRPDESKKAYELRFSDKEGQKGLFVVHLVKLENKLFLDVYPTEPPWDEEDPNKVKWQYNTLLFVPAHTFIKINSIGPELKMQLTDDDEIKKLLKAEPDSIKHVEVENGVLLTAPTSELQAFIVKYADDNRVFITESVLTRSKDKNAQQPGIQDPNKG